MAESRALQSLLTLTFYAPRRAIGDTRHRLQGPQLKALTLVAASVGSIMDIDLLLIGIAYRFMHAAGASIWRCVLVGFKEKGLVPLHKTEDKTTPHKHDASFE